MYKLIKEKGITVLNDTAIRRAITFLAFKTLKK